MSTQTQARPQLSPEQHRLFKSFNQLRDRAINLEGEADRLTTEKTELRNELLADLRAADDEIAALKAERATLHQQLKDRDNRIADLEERNEREIARNARMVTTFDSISNNMQQMYGEVHADQVVNSAVIIPPGPPRDKRIPDFSILEDEMRHLLGRRPRESGEHTGGYVEQLEKEISETAKRSGLAEAAAESSESVKT